MTRTDTFAPGTRILVRDCEWLVRRVDLTSTGGCSLDVIGHSELVRDKDARFLTEVEETIEVLDPAETTLVPDTSSAFRAALLHMESLLRKTTPTDNSLYCGHKAAMDPVPYQRDPALMALDQPRQRILIADAVGLGKTLEAGVLISELIRRGRGKRILVVTVKSMLTQFQKEMWSRFTIPLTRLDSVGIKRVRATIPTNHNPFYYYDKSIVSVDTLKQSREYQVYLENAWWDIIVIDEAQNVAERGTSSSQRARLARLLAGRSDTLILLSATPHDGRARSFASLMNMLDPTAIADPDDYTRDDIEGLFIRRFKKDIQQQVASAFQERDIATIRFPASAVEERAYEKLAATTFQRIDKRARPGELFKTTLEKALFSSPAACLQTVENRIARLEKLDDPDSAADIAMLEDLADVVANITADDFSKYQALLSHLQEGGARGAAEGADDGQDGDAVHRPPPHHPPWTGRASDDRLVIFTERIDTLRFLETHLPGDLGLRKNQVAILHGTLSDVDQQRIVEDFGKEESPIRLLIASDVASEGINLHYLAHRMIHFDIPWSLMVFQQRNGRIDRYGQEQRPQIAYLVTESCTPEIRGDMRILELLIEKDEQAHKNIGDPRAFMGVYDEREEERLTATAIEQNQTPADLDAALAKRLEDPLAILLGAACGKPQEDGPPGRAAAAESSTAALPALYAGDYEYLAAALKHINSRTPLQHEFFPAEQRIELTPPADLLHRFRVFPRELRPADNSLVLCADTNTIQAEIKRSRKDEFAWPRIHYLWEQNPVLEWASDKVLASFGRHEAPILTLDDVLPPGEVIFVLAGLIPNRKGHPLIQRWFGVAYRDGAFATVEEFAPLAARLELGRRTFPNRGAAIDTAPLQALLPDAIDRARASMSAARTAFEQQSDAKLQAQYDRLDALRRKKHAQLDAVLARSRQAAGAIQQRRERETREIDRLFDEFLEWIEETKTTEDNPYIKVVAAITGQQP